MILLLLLGFGIVAGVQVPSLLRQQWRKELISFAVLWAIGLVLSLMILRGITLPPLSTLINAAITSMFGI